MSQVAERGNTAPTIAELINQQAPAIARVMSGDSEEDRKARASRFARIALSTIRGNDKLAECSSTSLLSALMTCATFDMEPDPRGLVYLVPYKREATFQLGYKGMIELAIRSGQVLSVFAEVVYEAEAKEGMFSYHGGIDRRIEHSYDILRPELRSGKIVAAYAVAEMANGTKQLAVVDRAHINKRMQASMGAGSSFSPWKGWEEEMCKKTAIKALCKTLPQSVEKLHLAIAEDDAGIVRMAPPAVIETPLDGVGIPAITATDLNAATE